MKYNSHKIWKGEGEAVELHPYITACLISSWSRTTSKLKGIFCSVEFSPQMFTPGQNHLIMEAPLGSWNNSSFQHGHRCKGLLLCSFIYYSLKDEFLFYTFEGSLPRL